MESPKAGENAEESHHGQNGNMLQDVSRLNPFSMILRRSPIKWASGQDRLQYVEVSGLDETNIRPSPRNADQSPTVNGDRLCAVDPVERLKDVMSENRMPI